MAYSSEVTQLARRGAKSAAAFRTISEVADELDIPPHVLRFWETKFSQIKPLKRGGGRRYYRPEDVELLRRIRELLYRDGYTIKGVQRLLRDTGARALAGGALVADLPRGDGASAEPTPPSNVTPLNVEAPRPLANVAPLKPRRRLDPELRAEIEAALGELAELKKLLNGLKR
ncbi:MAG: MerR family transcriptional regulator [Alphaproteobacteria bacterium]|nr:MerR family transcriptional regulator [Alphaproteobacteria bacterium]